MKFISFCILFIASIPILFAQCNSLNEVVITELTFETPNDATINVKNNSGQVYNLQQKKVGSFFKNIGLEVKDLGSYSFKANHTEASCFRLVSTTDGCLPSNTVCLPDWKLRSEPNQNVIEIIPTANDEIIILKNNIQDYKYVTMNTPFKYIDENITCRKDDIYRIVLINGDTKINTFKWSIRALSGDCAVYDIVVPTIFTPNGDGHNDSLTLLGKPEDFYSISIFDKWNNTVFETPTLTTQWNGNFNNNQEPLPDGMYQYSLKKMDKQANFITVNGYVLLVR